MPIDTTPPYAPPAETKIEEAARALPDMLSGMESRRDFANEPPSHQDRLVLAADLVKAIASNGMHTQAAAAHAIHRLVQRALLKAEIARAPEGRWCTSGTSPELIQCFKAIDGAAFDPIKHEPKTMVFPAHDLHDGNGPVPFDKLIIRSTTALWDANRAGTVSTRDRFHPNKPRPDRATVDRAKRDIQQNIFDHWNAEGEDPPPSPHRAVNGAIFLVNCGGHPGHAAFQWAVYEMELDGVLVVRPAVNPQILSVFGERQFATGGGSIRRGQNGEVVLRDDETPLGLFVLETTDRMFAGELGRVSAAVVPPTDPPRRPAMQVPLDVFHSQSVAAHEHGLMTYDTITVFPGETVDVTGYSCKVIAGDRPTPCPDARPVLPPSMLDIALRAVRRLNRLPQGTTIHWVGHDTGIRSRCRCHPDAPYAAPFDRHRWASVVARPAEVNNAPSSNVLQALEPQSATANLDSGAGAQSKLAGAASESDDLTTDEFAIVDELIQRGAIGERRKFKQKDIARFLGREENDWDLVRLLAELVKRRLLKSRTGRGAGYFVTPSGQESHKKYTKANRPKS